MTKTIAIAGKGGTGKTTIAALFIRYLVEHRLGPVLAIDADPSTNLNIALGVELDETVGDIREDTLDEIQSGSNLGGMSKPDYIDLRIQQCLVEEDGFDLLAMGRPEGPGCYCAANNFLRMSIDRLARSYRYVVIDNEAGLEHISRRTTRDVDVLLIISDPTMRGIIAAQRVADLVQELDNRVERTYLVLNRVPQGDDGSPVIIPELEKAITERGLSLIGIVPLDPVVARYDALGRPLVEIPPQAPVSQAVEEIIRAIDGLI